MSILADLRTFVLEDHDVESLAGSRMFQNVTPQDTDPDAPRIWYRRSGREDLLTLDGEIGPKRIEVDVECVAADIEQADALADAVWTRLHGYTGPLGDYEAEAVFCEDQDDDYVPKSIGADEGLHVSALFVKVWITE